MNNQQAKGTPPRLGFLGTGWIGRNRMQAISESGAAEVAMICDSSSGCVEEALRIVPGAKVAQDFEELLNSGLDGLVIATPSALHAQQSIKALDRGLAVFCQKPLGRKAEEVLSIVSAAENANRLLGVDLSYRFTEGMRLIQQAISRGEIGHVYAIDLVFHNAYGPDKPWFYDSKLSGGGCVMDLGVHLVDLALWALDFPSVEKVSSTVFSKGQALRRESGEVEDYAVATLNLHGGTVAQLACSWNLPAGCDAVITADFYGTDGGLSFRNVNGSFYDFKAEQFRGTSRTDLSNPPDAWGGRAAVAWAQQLAENPAFDPGIRNAIPVAYALDRIYGREVFEDLLLKSPTIQHRATNYDVNNRA
jgi:predicted dehydrogenase